MNWLVPSIVISTAMALAAWAGIATGIINIRLTQKRDEVEKGKDEQSISSTLIQNALELVDRLNAQIDHQNAQIKDQRSEIQTIEQQQLQEAQVLRDRLRMVEARVGELEFIIKQKDEAMGQKDAEIRDLKAALYDALQAQKPKPGRARAMKVVPKDGA